MTKLFSNLSVFSRALLLASLAYVLFYTGYMFVTIPETFRADFLYHLSKIVGWDRAKDYGQYLPFIFEFQSGHIIALQKLFALLNFYVFQHSAVFSKLFGIANILLFWVIPIYFWSRRSISPATAVATFLFSLLVFSPHLSEIYDWSDAITAHYTTAIFALFAILSAEKALTAQGKPCLKSIFCCMAATATTIVCNGSGWAILPALLAMLALFYAPRLMQQKAIPLKTILIILGACVVLAAMTAWVMANANAGQGSDGPYKSPHLLLEKPHLYAMHVLSSIATPWFHFSLAESWPAGIVVLVLLAFLAIQGLGRNLKEARIWVTLSLFGLIGCGMVSVARFVHDNEIGFVAYRYTIYSMPIYTGMLGLITLLYKDWTPRLKTLFTPKKALVIIGLLGVGASFILSTFNAYKKETYQNSEVRAAHIGLQNWNMQDAYRITSSYEIPRLYLDLLPTLKAANKAEAMTGAFVPAGTSNETIDKALEALRSGAITDASQSNLCSKDKDARLNRVEYDERILPRIRKFGTAFIRANGYIRDVKDCAQETDILVMVDKDGKPMCKSRTNGLVYWDLQKEYRDDPLMRSAFIFDFSCPVLKDEKDIFPIKIIGYNTKTGTISLIGQSDKAVMPKEIPN